MMLAVYYLGGTEDRFFVAPAGLSIAEARKQRVSRWYKTEWGARQAQVSKEAAARSRPKR